MTTALDLDSYILYFMARQWHLIDLTYTALFAFFKQLTETWITWEIWPTVETRYSIWHTESGLCKILQPFSEFGSGWGNCKIEGQGYFQAVHSKETKCFGIKIYKLCDESGYTYDTRVYLSEDSRFSTDDMIATHTIVRHLTHRVQSLGHKLFMDIF
jgi:hypothetical protein